ncbi:hypothetical protein SUGI_0788860 [Cryptomeria japonica]|nr:hypothetical protein SUGI_0788860 [Cryptomeria japonica]
MACCFLCFVREANGCQYPQRCGYLNINYPFNIKGSNCGHSNFSLVCKHNSTFGEGNTTFLSTPTGEYQVLKLSNDSLLINVTHLKAISCSVSQTGKQNFSLPRKGPFTISGSNVFASVGCYANGSFSSVTPTSKNITVGGMCAASCLKIKNPDYCNGFGCCQTTFMENWRKVKFEAMPYAKPTSGKCVFSTILDPATFKIEESDKGKFGAGTYGLKIDWGINVTETNICSTAKRMDNLCCSNHAHCKDVIGMPDYKVCVCDDGYEGDGYQGGLQCTDIDECADPKLNDCIPPPVGLCRNLEGSFTCSCTKGEGDGRKSCTEKASILIPLLIGIFSSLVGGYMIAGAIVWAVKKRKQKLLRRKYFLQNRGLLLQEYISSDRGRRKATIAKEQRNLTALFLSKKGQGLLHEIFDPRLMGMDHIESMTSVANLAEACLNVDVQRRPSMKDVVQELLWIKNGKMRGGEGYTWQSHKDINEEETSVLIDLQERSHQIKSVKFDESSNVIYSSSGSDVFSSFQIENINSEVGSEDNKL